MNNLVVSGLVDTGLSVNGERVFLKNDRKVVVRGNAVVVLADLGKPVSARFERRPRRRVRTNWTPVTVEFNGGQFDREAAAKAPKTAPGQKTNIPFCSKFERGGKKSEKGNGKKKR